MNIDRLQKQSGIAAAHTEQLRRFRRRTVGRNSGASLVEVLVVLVVILIGVFAVIQIFPIGFTSLARSESRLRADRLARNITEELAADSSELPESISFSWYSTGSLQSVTDIDPDNLGDYQDSYDNHLYFSDVNKFRYIKNEPVRVPLASATNTSTSPTNNYGFGNGVGSVHFLKFGPIFMDQTVGDPATAPNTGSNAQMSLYDSYLKVTSDKLIGVVVNSTGRDNTLDDPGNYVRFLRGANSYVIDYGDDNSDAVILFPRASRDRNYTITYSAESDGDPAGAVTSANQIITVPAGTLAWRVLTNHIQPGSEVVTRSFTRLTTTDNWDPEDPYQYKLVSPNISTHANLGVIAFNPAGANYSVTIPGGTKPFTALVSYAVLDWHILHDDLEVPRDRANGQEVLTDAENVAKVSTLLPNIRVKSDEFTDFGAPNQYRNQVYPGLYPQKDLPYVPGEALPDNNVSPDIQVFNLTPSDGTVKKLVQGDLANRTTTDASADYWINRAGRGGTYPTGTIYINTARVAPGSKIRVLYKAQGNWAIAFQKAASQYRSSGTAGPATGEVSTFGVDGRGTGVLTDDRIYFHLTELNKGVTATIELTTTTGVVRLPSRQFTISTADGTRAYASISDIAPEVNDSNVLSWRVAGNINGASLKTRVIWQDENNGRFQWRMSDLETFVTRQAQ